MNRCVNLNNIKWVCHHLHIDKSKTIHPKLLSESLAHMKEKWYLMREIKKIILQNHYIIECMIRLLY